MKHRILLIDDESVFLKILSESLIPLAHLIDADTATSVDEAQKKIIQHHYDLIITDVRMPNKTGIDLLIFLREIQYKGAIMAMSAYNTQDSIIKMKELGVITVLSKPFDLSTFKAQIQQTLKDPLSEQIASIGLVSVLQIINLDQKTVLVQIEYEGLVGFVYLVKGEIVHAEFNGFIGEEALMRMIAIGDKSLIAVRPLKQKKIRRTITLNFIEQMMEIMKTIDELNLVQDQTSEKDCYLLKEENMAVQEILKQAKEISGYLGIGVFTPQGELLEGEADATGIHFESAGAQIHDTLLNAQKMSQMSGFGRTDMVQIDTESGLIFAKCYNDDKSVHFHTVLILKREGNVAMAKLKLKKMVEELVQEM